MTTSEPQATGGSVSNDPASMLSLVDFPASPFRAAVSDEASLTSDGVGRGWLMLFALYDRATSSWRTSQTSLQIEMPSPGFSETWPTWGSMRNGACFVRPTSASDTDADDSHSWPTPRAQMSRLKVQARPKRVAGTNLEEAVFHRTGETGGYLNPRWIEWLMGFPFGWSKASCTDSGTP